MNEGVEFIKKQLKSIERKIKSEEDRTSTWRAWINESDEKLRILKAQKEELSEMIKPHLFVENLEGKK